MNELVSWMADIEQKVMDCQKLEEIFNFRCRCDNAISEIKKLRKQIDDALLSMMKLKDVKQFELGDRIVKRGKKTKIIYDQEGIINTLTLEGIKKCLPSGVRWKLTALNELYMEELYTKEYSAEIEIKSMPKEIADVRNIRKIK